MRTLGLCLVTATLLIGCSVAGGAGNNSTDGEAGFNSTAGGANGTGIDSRGFSITAGTVWTACIAAGFETVGSVAPAGMAPEFMGNLGDIAIWFDDRGTSP